MKRMIWLILICGLNLADFALTVYMIRSGIGREANPVAPVAGPILKLAAVPFFAGLTNITAARAEKEGARRTGKIVDWIVRITTTILGVVVLNNLLVLIFHCGFLDMLGVA